MLHIIDIRAESLSDTIDFIVRWNEDCEIVMISYYLFIVFRLSIDDACWYGSQYCCRLMMLMMARLLTRMLQIVIADTKR